LNYLDGEYVYTTPFNNTTGGGDMKEKKERMCRRKKEVVEKEEDRGLWVGIWYLATLSTIFQPYCGGGK
jgi:hypothetical protein